jgi:hypothetical protein
MNKNVRPGVCGICGVAVVQPENQSEGWHSGHFYKLKLKDNQTKYSEAVLAKVRCLTHKEPGDHRHYDKDGNVVETIYYDDVWC